MKLPEHERQAHREAFRAMSLPEKAGYILAYYKLPLVIALIALVALGTAVKPIVTHRDMVLYLAYANVSIPEQDDDELAAGFLEHQGADPARCDVYRYRDLYLADPEQTADHQYSYASRLKVLAVVDAKQLDVVIMNHDSYDLLSASGYLLDLEEALAGRPDLQAQAQGNLCRNVVVLSDNKVEVDLGEADAYEAVTEEHANALEATDLLGGSEYLTGDVYLGIIGNTPRLEESLDFVEYLYQR